MRSPSCVKKGQLKIVESKSLRSRIWSSKKRSRPWSYSAQSKAWGVCPSMTSQEEDGQRTLCLASTKSAKRGGSIWRIQALIKPPSTVCWSNWKQRETKLPIWWMTNWSTNSTVWLVKTVRRSESPWSAWTHLFCHCLSKKNLTLGNTTN